jgi:hypothetical protein
MQGRRIQIRWLIVVMLWIATMGLWCRSLFVRDEICFNAFSRLCMINSFPHHVHIRWFNDAPYHGPVVEMPMYGTRQIAAVGRYLELRLDNDARSIAVAFPYWIPWLVLTSIIAWNIGTRLRRRRHFKAGCCVNCGYDLRATPDRCPECGTPASTQQHPIA